MSNKTLEAKLRNVKLELQEQKASYEISQYMLMREVIKFVEAGDYTHLKQFCYNYAGHRKV